VAGKVTVGLASHWSYVTDIVAYPPTYGLSGLGKGDEHPAYSPMKYYGIFTRETDIIPPDIITPYIIPPP